MEATARVLPLPYYTAPHTAPRATRTQAPRLPNPNANPNPNPYPDPNLNPKQVSGLETLCVRWSIPEDVAGASFMAFGRYTPSMPVWP